MDELIYKIVTNSVNLQRNDMCVRVLFAHVEFSRGAYPGICQTLNRQLLISEQHKLL